MPGAGLEEVRRVSEKGAVSLSRPPPPLGDESTAMMSTMSSGSPTFVARTQTLGFLGRSRGAVPCLRMPQTMSFVSNASDPYSGASPASGSRDPCPQGCTEVRLRFFNFNMANNSNYAGVDDLQGPAGRGSFVDLFRGNMRDGRPMDVTFVTLVETRVNLRGWRQQFLDSRVGRPGELTSMLVQNARREGKQNTRSRVRGWMEGLGALYNGNLKSMLVFSDQFAEDKCAQIFGRLVEARVVGVPVPNPKKAFMGRSIRTTTDQQVRLSFISAHFPVAKLAAALEDKGIDQLHGAKVALARSLRKVLRRAAVQGVAGDNAILFLQGDLNSRTVLRHEAEENEYAVTLDRTRARRLGVDVAADDSTTYRGSEALLVTTLRGGVADLWNRDHPYEQVRIGDVVIEVNGVRGDAKRMLRQFAESQMIELKLHRKVTDVLLEVLRDDDMQEAIQHELGLPPGRWHEIAHYEIVHDLPVTYKFLDSVACGSTTSHTPTNSPSVGGAASKASLNLKAEPLPFPLTVGDIVACQSVEPIAVSGVVETDDDESPHSPRRPKSTWRDEEAARGKELYRQHLANLGERKLAEFGLVYKKNDFRAFRFPACADRVLFWAPDKLADRMTFDLLQDGYEVNHSQLGSDHRPVTLDVVMRIAPQGKHHPSERPPARKVSKERTSLIVKEKLKVDLVETLDADNDQVDLSSGEESPERKTDRDSS